jgi:oryzin
VPRLARRDAAHEPIESTFSIGTLNAYLGDFNEASMQDIQALDEVLSIAQDEYVYLEKTQLPTTSAPRPIPPISPHMVSLGDPSHNTASAAEYAYDTPPPDSENNSVHPQHQHPAHTRRLERASALQYQTASPTHQTPAAHPKDVNSHGTHCVAEKASAVHDTSPRRCNELYLRNRDKASCAPRSTKEQYLQHVCVRTKHLPRGRMAQSKPSAYNQGILSVVVAGSENSLVGENSPARLPGTFTVGMMQPDCGRVGVVADVYGGNCGPEMDVFASGRDIVSAGYLGDTGNSTKMVTTMATPLVAGLVCYLRALEGGLGSRKKVMNGILQLALKDIVGDPKGSPNLMINNGSSHRRFLYYIGFSRNSRRIPCYANGNVPRPASSSA